MSMESLESAACFINDLLDFSSDIGEEDDDDAENHHLHRHNRLRNRRAHSSSLHEFAEEELEWISNKDAFPMVESLVDIMPHHPSIATNHRSPVSVLESSNSNSNSNSSSSSNSNISGAAAISSMLINLSGNFKVPGKARSKQLRRRRRDMLGQQFWAVPGKPKLPPVSSSKPSSTMGRKCLHCGAEKTPQWRAGPLGPKTLCNACGVRYKSGRLVPEYRPASSPSFSSELHSNSHRKIMEMRRQKVVVSEPAP